jgi:hypothetical protein
MVSVAEMVWTAELCAGGDDVSVGGRKSAVSPDAMGKDATAASMKVMRTNRGSMVRHRRKMRCAQQERQPHPQRGETGGRLTRLL